MRAVRVNAGGRVLPATPSTRRRFEYVSFHADGIIVNDIGLEPLIVALQRLVLLPLARELFSADDRGDPATGFDSTHAFVVKYRADEDSHLDVHTDDSDGR